MDGITALPQIRERARTVVVVLTASDAEEYPSLRSGPARPDTS
jgi:CheY-like chemotaxis protein